MQSGFRRNVQRCPDAIRHQRIQGNTFIDFIEMRQGLAGIEQLSRSILDRRAVDVIQETLGKVRGRRQILQPLLILDAHGRAPKLVCDPKRRDIHLALLKHLGLGQICLWHGTKSKLHTLVQQPLVHAAGFPIRSPEHFRI